MEILEFIAEQAVSLVLGFCGGWAYHQFRLWNIRRHAPSAKEVDYIYGLSQEDYDRLPKKQDNVMYVIGEEKH